ncbi:MAG TPA: hypothetical protein VE981_10515 [Planctomycetota bacterium]|nr:hypothetical protein [Planctomycetota bacterium]
MFLHGAEPGGRTNPAEKHQILTHLFIAVCNLSGDERRRELERLCKGNADLRGELELLLGIHDSVVAAGKSCRESTN